MKKKNGFTLVELMGIIIILLLIALIAVPSIIKMNRNTEQTNFENYTKDAKMAAETYIELNMNLYPELKTVGEDVTIPLTTLVSEGFMNNDIKNPKTKEKPNSNEAIVITVNEDKTLTYNYVGN